MIGRGGLLRVAGRLFGRQAVARIRQRDRLFFALALAWPPSIALSCRTVNLSFCLYRKRGLPMSDLERVIGRGACGCVVLLLLMPVGVAVLFFLLAALGAGDVH